MAACVAHGEAVLPVPWLSTLRVDTKPWDSPALEMAGEGGLAVAKTPQLDTTFW